MQRNGTDVLVGLRCYETFINFAVAENRPI